MALEAHDIFFRYGSRTVLSGVSLRFEPGHVVSLLGPNGCGKTTFLKVLLGLLPPWRGEVRLDGVPIRELGPSRLARRIAYVPQAHRATFAYRVADVVVMGRLPHGALLGRFSARDRATADQVLERLGIAHLAERPYTELSGGERQLTLIARALAQGAETFVMDEPATALDYGHQVRLLQRIAALAKEGLTFIQSTHSPEHALWAADRVVLFRDGAVVADGAAGQEINAANLELLYRVPIEVHVAGGRQVCVPAALR